GEIKQEKRRQTLIDFADQVRLSRELVTLTCDAPLPCPIDELAVADPGEELAAFLAKMEFNSLARRVEARTGVAPPVQAPGSRPDSVELPADGSIDTSFYECVREAADLDRWIARAYEVGIVAFDTETDALSSATANLCGVSLAVAPGEACYIPVGHCEAEG